MERKEKTILAVDDEPSVTTALELILGDSGYNVFSASTVTSAWNEYKRVKPDLVITDLLLPDSTGIELLRQIRAEDLSTQVILITAHGSIEVIEEAIKCGAYYYLDKPFTPEQLLTLVERALQYESANVDAQRSAALVSILERDNERLKELIKQLSGGSADQYRAFLGAAAHDLKGEFLHIGDSVKAIRESTNRVPDIKEECDLIERSVEYSQLLLRRLLDYVDIGGPRVESIRIVELLRRTESLARPRLPSSVKLEITEPPNIEQQVVSTDIEQLMGVLLELINNAANVLREKGGRIWVKVAATKGKLAISVKDNGPGVPRDLRDRLLKEQVSSRSGLGLGLFLSNRVVTAMGGKLSLQASSKKGTTFRILLPMTTKRTVSRNAHKNSCHRR